MSTGAALAARTLLLALCVGCADDEGEVSLPCDVTERSCQKAVFRATAEMRGQTDARLPDVRVITRRQLALELRAALEESATDLGDELLARREQVQRALSLLELLPEPSEQSADDAYIAQAVDSIAAYYSDSSKDITVISDQTTEQDDALITLSHEFVHALQDQRDDLAELRAKYVESTDDDLALTSLIEGEADWLAYATYFDRVRNTSVERIIYRRLFGAILNGTLQAIEESGAPLIETSELIPYPVGGRFVAELDLTRGLDSVAALYDDPPLALRSWVENAPPELPAALDCDVPSAPEGYRRIDSDRLGFGGLMAYRIAQGEAGLTAYNAALHWRSDKIATYAAEADDASVAMSWRIVLDTEPSAQSLAALANASGAVSARAQGKAVVLSAATDPALLMAWRPNEGCPAFDKGRADEPSGLLASLKRRLGITP